jgi:hypothetical protein
MTRTLLSGLAATGLAICLCAPANATLQIAIDVNGSIFTCSDGAACDQSSTPNVLQLANQSIGGVTVNGSIQSSGTSPDFLNTSSLSVINTNTFSVPIEVTVGQTGFPGPVIAVDFAGAGTWQFAAPVGAPASDVTLSWFADAANTQGANSAGDTPGTLLGTFASTAAGTVDSFNTNGAHPFVAAGPFSMTEDASGTLAPGGQLINRGQNMVAVVPEPQTWALMVLGFTGLGYVGFHRSRKAGISTV